MGPANRISTHPSPPLSIPGTVLFFPHLIPLQVLNLKRKNPHRPPLGVLPNLMPKKKLPTKKNSPVNTTFFIRKNACPLTKKNSAIYHTLQQGGGASWHRRICMRLKQNKIIRLGVLLVGRVYGPEVLATWCGWI